MTPHVSCLCITKNRRIFLRQAVQYFFAQLTHYNQPVELVIVDGSEEPNPEFSNQTEVLSGEDWSVRYFHHPSPTQRFGHWRNVGVDHCQGTIIVHWDDDDWHSADRVARQVGHLQSGEITGTNRFYWYSILYRQAARSTSWEQKQGLYGAGASFAYTKEAWKRLPFREDLTVGEDTYFLKDHAQKKSAIFDSGDPDYHLYVRHNTNGSVFSCHKFTEDATRQARSLLQADTVFYDELAEILPLAQHNDLTAKLQRRGVNSLDVLRARHFKR